MNIFWPLPLSVCEQRLYITRQHVPTHLFVITVSIAFTRLRKDNIWFVGSVYQSILPTARLEKRRLTGRKFTKFWYLRNFRKYVEKFKNDLKSDKNSEYFTWRRMCSYDNISRNYSQIEKCFRQNSFRTHVQFSTNIFRNLCRLLDFVEKCNGAREAMDDNIIKRR